jgi:hypothetical protein
MDFTAIPSVSVPIPTEITGNGLLSSAIQRRKDEKAAILRVFRTSRDMHLHHKRLITDRKPVSQLPTPASRLSPGPGDVEESGHKRQGSDACTETDLDGQFRFGILIERKRNSVGNTLPKEVIRLKDAEGGTRRLLFTAGSPRNPTIALSSKGPRMRKKREMLSETLDCEKPAARTIPFIDFNSTVRTTVVHVEEAFIPSRTLRSSLGFYSGFPLRTSPRTKRLPLSAFSHKPSPLPPQSPFPSNNLLEEGQPRSTPITDRSMWQYRGPALPTSIFDPLPIATLRKRLL